MGEVEERIIKFRALDSDNNWIYGLPYTDGINDTVYYEDFNNRLCWRNEEGGHCNKPYKNGTLRQFIGLSDDNEVEIYEDSLLKITWAKDMGGDSFIRRVERHDSGEFYVDDVENGDCDYHSVWALFECGEFKVEVIGSYQENPELLNTGKGETND